MALLLDSAASFSRAGWSSRDLERRGVVPSRAGTRTARGAASMSWSLGDRSAARAMATRALDVAVGIDDRLEQHALHNLLGVLEIGAEDLDEAERQLTQAIATADAEGRRDLVMTATTNLSIVYLSSPRLDEARAALHEVLAYRTTQGHTEGIGFARLNLGEVEFAAGHLDDAEAHFSGAAEIFRAVGFRGAVGQRPAGSGRSGGTDRPPPERRSPTGDGGGAPRRFSAGGPTGQPWRSRPSRPLGRRSATTPSSGCFGRAPRRRSRAAAGRRLARDDATTGRSGGQAAV